MAATPERTFDPRVWRDNGPERERRKETCSVGRGQRGWRGSGGEDGGERRSGKAAPRLRSEHLARAFPRARRFRNCRDSKSHAASRALPCVVPWACSSSLLSSSECGWLLPLVTVLARLLDRTPAPERSITEGMAATNTHAPRALYDAQLYIP